MDLSLTLSNRQIVPSVVNVYQYENDTNVMKFTLDSYLYGEVDLRNYTPYVITSQNGLIDYTEAEMNYDEVDDVVTLTWGIQEYSLREKGAVLYQICFKETTTEGEIEEGENTAVFYSYKAIVINRGSVDGDHHLTANYPTLLKQWLDKMNAMKGELDTIKTEAIEEMEAVRKETVADINGLVDDFTSSVIYIPYGETLTERIEGRLYYQYTDIENTKGQFEDHEGNVLSELDTSKTNCIISVPQDVKLELVDGVLTLKAGSKYYFGDESNHQTTIDYVLTAPSTTTRGFIFALKGQSGFAFHAVDRCVSGQTDSLVGTNSHVWFDTANKIIKRYGADAESYEEASFPLAIVSASGGSYISIDQVFNGFGHIGSTRFMTPNVKGLIPNGRNADGSLKTIEWVSKNVYTATISTNGNVYMFQGLDTDNFMPYFEQEEQPTISGMWFDPVSNYMRRSTDSGATWVIRREFLAAMFTQENNVIVGMDCKKPFHAADYNEVNEKLKGYLPLSGGTLTGKLTSKLLDCAFEHISPTTGEGLRIGVGASGTNRGIYDVGSNRWMFLANPDGSVHVNTLGDNVHYLACNADGTINWDGTNIVRSINGELANGNGNVEVIAYDDLSMHGTELTFHKTNGGSTSIDLGKAFTTTTITYWE